MKSLKNEKGFAVAGIVYALLIFFLIVVMLTLGIMMNRKNIINKYTKKAQTEIIDRLESITDWIYADSNDNGKVDTGDIINLHTEKFYIISNDGTTIRALAKYNLLVGNEYDGTNLTPVTGDNVGLQDESAKGSNGLGQSTTNKSIGVTRFSAAIYWDDSGLKPEYGTLYPAYVYDNNSTLYQYLEAYKTKLAEMNSGYLTVDLIKQQELINLGCDASINATCTSSIYSWTYTTSYWTGSAEDSKRMWYVRCDGGFFNFNYNYATSFGVRPVVTIPLKNMVNN